MKATNYILLFSTIITLSCQDKFINDIDVDIPDHEQKLVINLDLRSDQTLVRTFVSKSQNINDETQATLFDNASVQLYKDNASLTELFFDEETRNYIGQIDSTDLGLGTYRVEASVSGFGNISSEQEMPKVVQVESAEYEANGTVDVYYGSSYEQDALNISFTDPSDEANYYTFELEAIAKYMSGDSTNRTINYLSSINPLIERTYNGDIFLTDKSFNGKKFDLIIGFDSYIIDNITNPDINELFVKVKLINVSKDFYLYAKSQSANQIAEDNPFAEPVIVHNNIENGLGIFTAAAVSEFVLKIN